MPDPLTELIVAQVYEDTDSPIAEVFNIPGGLSYQLGSGLSPVYPGGAPLIPKGAGFYGPTLIDAPTNDDPITDGGLVDNGVYSWAVTVVTQWGESLPSNLLTPGALGTGNTGLTIVLPSITERVDNPIIYRRLYRTANAGSQLELVVEIEDANVSEYVDAIPDEDLTTPAPTTDTTGSFGSVDIYDGSSHWTEVSLGDTLTSQQFAVDYTVMDTGGTVHFYSGDIGTSVTATYYAGTFLGSAFLNQYKTGLQKVYDLFRTDDWPEFSHNLLVDGQFQAVGNVEFFGNLRVDGDSYVVGATTLNGALFALSTARIDGTLEVNSATDLDGALDVAGATVLNSTLHVVGATTLDSTLDVTGATTLHNTLHLVGAATLDNNLTVAGTIVSSSTSPSSVHGNFTVDGNLTVGGTSHLVGAGTFDGLITIGTLGGLHILGSPPNFQVANIFGSGGSLVTIGHSSNPQNFSVTGTSALNGDTDIGGVLKAGTITEHSLNAKTTFTTEVVTNTWINLFKMKAAGGTPGLSAGVGPGAATLAFTGSIHTDFAGLIHYVPNGSPAAGDQIQVTYSSAGIVGHSANPMVLVSLMTASASNAVLFYASSSGDLSFIIAAKDAPTAGVDYYIGYLVIN